MTPTPEDEGQYRARNNPVREEPSIKCPCCGWHQVLARRGVRARLRGDPVREIHGPALPGRLDPETEAFITIRDASGGRGRGFPILRRLTVAEAAADPTFRPYTVGLFSWARRLVALGDRLGL